MIVSVHLADVGPSRTPSVLRAKLRPGEVPGLRYAQTLLAAPLGGNLLPRPRPGRVGLITACEDDRSLDRFLEDSPLTERLVSGGHMRLQPTHRFGAWRPLEGLIEHQRPMDAQEPVAVITLGQLRLSQTLRFLRATAAAEALAVANPALLFSTGLARPPRLVATFSLWQSTAAMRAYAGGEPSAHNAHRKAIDAHARNPFHRESAFLRFRPYAVAGSWEALGVASGALDPIASQPSTPAPQ